MSFRLLCFMFMPFSTVLILDFILILIFHPRFFPLVREISSTWAFALSPWVINFETALQKITAAAIISLVSVSSHPWPVVL